MVVDNPQRGIDWDAAEEGETNSVQRWEEIVVKWHPLNRELAKILAGMNSGNRIGAAEDFSKIEGGDGENYMQFITNLASLSDTVFERIKLAIANTQAESNKRWKKN